MRYRYLEKMLCLLLLAASVISPTLSTNPGASILISQAGLNYGASIALDILTKAVQKISIPDLSDDANIDIGKVGYSVSNIKVGFERPTTDVTVQPSVGLTWAINNAGISISGDWEYKFKLAFLDLSDHGSFQGEASGASISVGVTLRSDSSNSGRLMISSTGCSAHLPQIKVRFSGATVSWLNDLFSDSILAPISGTLETLICEAARSAVDMNAGVELATLPVQAVIDHDWILDYRLVASPVFAAQHIQSFHKGEVFNKDNANEAPFQPDVLPNPDVVGKMVTIWMSDYVLNTAGYVLYKRDKLRYNLTSTLLPKDRTGFLSTTCPALPTCIGRFLPSVAKLFPNASLELELFADDAPKAVITPEEINGSLSLVLVFRARLSNGSLVYLFRTAVTVFVPITPRLNGTVIQGHIERIKISFKVIDSVVGNISTLPTIFSGVKQTVLDMLNEFGQKGFPLPVIKHVELISPGLTLESHALRLTTDIKYSP